LRPLVPEALDLRFSTLPAMTPDMTQEPEIQLPHLKARALFLLAFHLNTIRLGEFIMTDSRDLP
jgi:hypothetical protein